MQRRTSNVIKCPLFPFDQAPLLDPRKCHCPHHETCKNTADMTFEEVAYAFCEMYTSFWEEEYKQ